MQLDHRPTRVAIVGNSGSGKTTYLVRFLSRAKASVRFVFDPEGELGPKLGAPTVNSRREALYAIGSGWVVYDPTVEFPGDNEGAFAWFAEFAFHACAVFRGRKFFVVDEAQKFIPCDQKPPKGARLIFDTGRRYGLDVAMVSQAPNLIHHAFRNQFTELVTFHLADPNARKWVNAFGVSRDPSTIPPGQYLARNLQSGGELGGRVY